ncbi:single-stranded DNA-binding protein [bacterium 3DAC]|nr:single-stranded DNA-binding protein [Dictyoglomota bacterium]UZN23233.1 single-stranded DNA-binding protein [bacterium 3DAC]
MNANNTVVLVGRVASQPDIRYVGTTKKLTFRIAVKKSFKRQNDDVDAYFIPIAVWGGRADGLEKLIASGVFQKGTLVSVVGELRVDSYEDRSGIRRKSIEVAADSVQILSTSGNAARPEVIEEEEDIIKELGDIDKDIDALDSFEESVSPRKEVDSFDDDIPDFPDDSFDDDSFDPDVLP